MANELRYRASIKDDVSGPLDRIKDKFGQVQKEGAKPFLSGVAAGAGIAAFKAIDDAAHDAVGAVVGFVAGSIQAAKEEQVGIARLDASLKANVAGWDGNTAAIEKNIDAMVRTTGFSDGDLRDSLARIVGSTHDVNKALAIQSTAMDLARFKGISLADASDALIKVEGGQFRALKGLGIVLKDGATQTEALAAVQKVAGGQMAAYADTLAGKTEVLQNRLQDLQEELGGHLTPAFLTATESALGFMDALDSSSDLSLPDRLKGVTDALNVVNPLMWTANLNAGFMGDAMAKASDQAGKAAAESAMAWDTGSERVGSDFKSIGSDAASSATKVDHAMNKIVMSAKDTRDALDKIGQDTADVLFDPLILKAELAANKREQAEQRAIIASKKSTKAQVADAKQRLLELNKDALEKEVSLIGYGKMNAKEQKAFLKDLETKWKHSTGEAKDDIGALIDAITGIPTHRSVTIDILLRERSKKATGGKAGGGPVHAGNTYLVGENGPELLSLGGSMNGSIRPTVGGGGGGGGSVSINVSTPLMTPGSSQALASTLAPLVAKELQRQQLIARR